MLENGQIRSPLQSLKSTGSPDRDVFNTPLSHCPTQSPCKPPRIFKFFCNFLSFRLSSNNKKSQQFQIEKYTIYSFLWGQKRSQLCVWHVPTKILIRGAYPYGSFLHAVAWGFASGGFAWVSEAKVF